MSLGRQAKVLTEAQTKGALEYLKASRTPARNEVMFLLSVDAGLRANEIAALEWTMVTDASGNLTDEIRLQNRVTKGRSGGVVFMSRRLEQAFKRLQSEVGVATGRVLLSKNGREMTSQVVVNWFAYLYRDLGFEGCSSHSGRRTAITRWARKISSVGGSLRDVQALARHSSLAMTQRYIEVSADACRKVVG